MPLPLEEADVVIGDFPIGYYPLDERSREMKLGFERGTQLFPSSVNRTIY